MVRRNNTFPLSNAQERMWILNKVHTNKSVYNVPVAIDLIGELDTDLLINCIQEIIDRHEVLRTKFSVGNGIPMQTVETVVKVPYQEIIFHNSAYDSQDLQKLLDDLSRRPLELSAAPVFNTYLIKLSIGHSLLLLVFHHIIVDEWSIGILLQELKELYEARLDKRGPVLVDLPIQYGEYAAWHRRWLQRRIMGQQEAYWKKTLHNLSEFDLPADRPRISEPTSNGKMFRTKLSQATTQKLRDFSRRESVTLNMLLLAVFNILLFRYTGQDDIAVGMPIANRDRVEFERLIGLFVNTLVIRTDLSGEPPFRELLARVKERLLEAYENRHMPFEKLLEVTKPERNLSRTPLFQVMFVMGSASFLPEKMGGVQLKLRRVDTGTSKFDLTLFVVDEGEFLDISIEYSTDLFNEDRIEGMLRHYQCLLEHIIEHPDKKIWELELVPEFERNQILTEWNNTDVKYQKDKCIHQLIEEQVERSPEAIAAKIGEQFLTYRELNKRANKLGNYLQKLGVLPDTLVAICMNPSLEMIVGLLGILKAGGAYIPIDPTYPKNRIEYMLKDANSSIVLTQQQVSEEVMLQAEHVILIDKEWPIIAKESDENPASTVTPDNLIYVIYTSGTTGKPKGAGVFHHGFVNLLNWFINEFRLTNDDDVLLISSLSFDLTQKNLYAPLIVGGRLHLSLSKYYAPEEIVETICRSKITWINCAPSVFYPLVACGTLSFQMKDTLRYVFLGGEPIAMSRLSNWIESEPNKTKIVNTYGPTECTDISASYIINERQLNLESRVPIGKPIYNIRLYILDQKLQILPFGIEGDLYVGGIGVGFGYINNIDLTLEKFVSDPFVIDLDARMYRTGDRARWLRDGNVDFLGRSDHQVKIRGLRIELGDVESALMSHPGVKEAAILVQESHNKRLVAYFVPEVDIRPTVDDLRRYLSEILPEYMLPTLFIMLDALPLTPNGKIDRRGLMALGAGLIWKKKEYVAPQTLTESLLTKIWSELLGVEKISIHDNFFELGGDSILCMQMISKANKVGLHLTPRQVFVYQNIAELSSEISHLQLPQPEQKLVTGVLPLLPDQRFLLSYAPPEPNWMNTYALFEVQQNWKISWWNSVIQQLLFHHDALRARFIMSEDGWTQYIVAPDDNVPFDYLDLSHLPDEEQESVLITEGEKFQKSLNLLDGPIMRLVYFDMGPKKFGRLLIIIHHLAFDGLSWNILLTDLETAWKQLDMNQRIQLLPKTTSIMQWTEKMIQYYHSGESLQEIAFWTEKDWAGVVPLPVDHASGIIENTVESANSVDAFLSVEETGELLEFCQINPAKVHEVLLAALSFTIARWTGGNSLLINYMSNGRIPIFDNVDLSRTVGLFAHPFPVFLDLESKRTFNDVLRYVGEVMNKIPNSGLGYGVLRYMLEDTEISRKLRSLPQPEVFFNYLGLMRPKSSMFRQIEYISSGFSPRNKRFHILETTATIVNNELRIHMNYSENIHARTTIFSLVNDFLKTVRSILNN